MRPLVPFVLLAACDAPTIVVATIDAATETSADAPTDARVCRDVRAPDGGVCDRRYDEDGDCIPDDCDDCPNVPQEEIVASKGNDTAGPACTHPPPFDTATRRVAFQGFSTAPLTWFDPEPAFGDERFRVVDGHATMGRLGGSERIAILPAGAASKDFVLTAVMRLPVGGTAGIVLRTAVSRPREGYLCTVTTTGQLTLSATKCDGLGVCTNAVLTTGTGMLAVKAIPAEVDVVRGFLMRAAVQTVSTSRVRLGCQIFPVPGNAADVAGTLRSLDNAKHTLILETDVVIANGEPAFTTSSVPLEIDSVDMLSSE